MQQSGRTYIAIDLKSFYASVECMERGLDPLTTNLVVADASRTEKTICLAVTPSLKAYGISGRARLFEVVERVKEVNAERRRKAGGELSEKSCDANKLAADPSREVDYALVVPEFAQNRSTTNGIGYAASMTREMIARSNPSRKNRYRRLSYECTTNSNTMASRFSLSSSLTSTLPKPAVSSGVKTSWRSTNKYRILPVRNDF